jgi:hypothetical protein
MSIAATNARLARVYDLNTIELGGDNVINQEINLKLFGDDFYANTLDTSARIYRAAGENGATVLAHRGTEPLAFFNEEAAPTVFYLSNTAGTPVETFRFDSAGRLLRPNQRIFHARYTNAAAFGSGVTIVFNDVQANVGSHYNAASGIFTAPYNGLYLFTCHMLMSLTTTADTRFALQKNSAAYAGSNFIRSAAVAGVNTLYGTALFQLLANDTVRVCSLNASTQFYQNADNANYSGFCGYLLG